MKSSNFNKNPFNTPPSYFDKLNSEILDITVNKKKRNPILTLNNQTLMGLSVAALILILFLIFNPFSTSQKITPTEISNANETVYELFLEENDTYPIAEDITVYDEYVYLMDE